MNKPKTLKGVIESSKNISGIIGNDISITGGIQAIGRDGVGLDFHWDGTKLGVKKENEKEYQYVDLRGKSTIDDLTDKHIYKALGYVPASTESLKREVYHLQVRDKEHDSLIKTLFEEIEDLQIKIGENELSIVELYELIDILDKTKANLSDIPAKLSDLEIDIEIGKDFTEEIKELTQNIVELSEIKADILYVDEQISLLSDDLKTKIDNNNSRIDILKSDLSKHIKLASIQYNELIKVINSKATIEQLKGLQKQIEELDIPEHIDLKPIENDMNKLFNLVEAKADKGTVNEELNKLQVQLDNLDIPEGVDLTPVYNELNKLKINKANISDIPTKVSQLDNDAQYITVEDVPECDISDIENSITQLQKLISNKADKVYVDNQISIIKEQIDSLDIPDEVDLAPIYSTLESLSKSKSNTTYVDTEVARLEKMIGELAGGEGIDLSDYALKKDIPRDLSQLSNDVGYVTITDIPEVDLTDINKQLIDLQNKKANKSDVIEDINKLQQEIDNLDIPEEIDLKPIQDSLELLKNDKASISYVQSEADKLNESITNVVSNIYEDYALKDELPTQLSELNNDTKFITIEEIPKVDLSDVKNDITNLEDTKADRVELPTKLSDLQNDTGYITTKEVDLTEIKNSLTELENKCTILELEKSDIMYVDNEIKKIRDLIDNIDIPEDVDLRPILKRIEELELSIDAELTKKVDKVEYISDIREIQNKLSSHGLDIAELNGEIVIVNSELKKKADTTYVDTRLNGYYKKSETYTKDEVNNRIAQIIGNAPENLDTLEKLANALDNDNSFASSITKELSSKVDKESGKRLSSNDFTNTYKLKLDGIEKGANRVEKLSDLINDKGYITLEEVPKVDLTPYATKSEVKNKLSDISVKDDEQDKKIQAIQNIIDGFTENVFIDDSKTEISAVGSYNRGITISSVSKSNMPSINSDSMLITIKTGLSKNAGQICIDEDGLLHGRKANFFAVWGEWVSGEEVDLSQVHAELNKLEREKANKSDVNELIPRINDLHTKLNDKADIGYIDNEISAINTIINDLDIPNVEPIKSDIKELQDNKADKEKLISEVARLEKTIKNIVTGETEDRVRIIPYITDTPIMNEVYYKQLEKKPPVSHWYPDDWGVWEVVSQNHLKCKATKTYDTLTTRITGSKGTVDIKIVKENKGDRHMLELTRDGKSIFKIRETKGDKEYSLKVEPGDRLAITSLFAGDVYLDYHGEDGDYRLYAYKNGIEERIANAYLVEKRLEDYTTKDESESAIELLDDTKANKIHTHSANDIQESYSKNFISTVQKLKINEIDNKSDKNHTHKEYEDDIIKIKEQIESLDIPEDIDLNPIYDALDDKVNKQELQDKLDKKVDDGDAVEFVNNIGGKRINLYGNMIKPKWGSDKDLTSMIEDLDKSKADKRSVVTGVNGKVGDLELDAYNIPINSTNPTWTINDELRRKASQYELNELDSKKADKNNVVLSINGKTGDVSIDSKNYDKDIESMWVAINNKAFNEHTHLPEEIYLNKDGDTLDKISASHIDYDGLNTVDDELKTKAHKDHNHNANDIHESFSKNFVSMTEKLKIGEVDDKADKTTVEELESKVNNKVDKEIKDKSNTQQYEFQVVNGRPGIRRIK